KVDYDYLSLKAKQYGVSNETKEQIERYYPNLLSQVELFVDIYKVDATISQSTSFKEKYERKINQEIQEWQRRNVVTPPVVIEGGGEDEDDGGQVATVQKQKIKASELIVVKELRSEEDVDQYINTLSNKLKQIIKSNKEIEFIE